MLSMISRQVKKMTEVKTLARFYRDYKAEHPDSDLTERQLRIACTTGTLKCARSGRLFLISETQFEKWAGGESDD